MKKSSIFDKEYKKFQACKTTQLRKIGKLLHIPNYSRKPRGELIDAILNLTSVKTCVQKQ